MSIPVTVRFTVDAPDMDALRRRAHDHARTWFGDEPFAVVAVEARIIHTSDLGDRLLGEVTARSCHPQRETR